jgi:hypothetical protein
MKTNKMKNLAGVLIILTTFQSMIFGATATQSQSVSVAVPEIVVLAKTGNPSALTIVTPAVAGTLPTNASDSSTYLQYSSNVLVSAPTTKRIITAQLSAAPTLGYGLKLYTPAVTASCGTGISVGSAVTLSSSTAQNIVTQIGNCFTGIGATNGAQLAYVTDITSMPYQGTDSLTVNFTITSAV